VIDPLTVPSTPGRMVPLQAAEDENGRRYPEFFRINFSRCIFCGFCEEVCPCAAIVMTPVHELATYDKEDFYLTKEKLLANQVNAHKELIKR
jgi:NADH-quinone oxidoreductase subunit I